MSTGNTVPVLVLKEGTGRSTGREAQKNNIMAAKIVAETVKTTLGPCGMDKMLVSSMGDVAITNDGEIAVISGKGGVGKSTITVNLAAAFALHGNRVGILDADIHGPSVPKLLGLTGQRLKVGPPGAFPAIGPLGIKVVSIDFFLPEERLPTIWRGPLKMRAIRQFLSDIVWGELDILFIDLPPGTGDEPLSIAQLLPEMGGVIIVTMPSELSRGVVKKAITFAQRLGMPIIGVVENMSSFICPNCGYKIDIFRSGGGKNLAEEVGVPFLGSIPIAPEVGVDSDKGSPFVFGDANSPAAKAFIDIVKNVEAYLRERENTETR